MATEEYSLRVINQRKHWKEGIKRLMEECTNPNAIAVLKSIYEGVDKMKLPTVAPNQNKKYLRDRAERPDPRDTDPNYNKKLWEGYHAKYNSGDKERKKKERW